MRSLTGYHRLRTSLVALLLVPSLAFAAPANTEERLRTLEQDIQQLKEENKALKQAHDDLKNDHSTTQQQVKDLLPLRGRFFGYVDLGLFYAMGNGSGIRADSGHALFPQYSDVPDGWVFYGDPL